MGFAENDPIEGVPARTKSGSAFTWTEERLCGYRPGRVTPTAGNSRESTTSTSMALLAGDRTSGSDQAHQRTGDSRIGYSLMKSWRAALVSSARLGRFRVGRSTLGVSSVLRNGLGELFQG